MHNVLKACFAIAVLILPPALLAHRGIAQGSPPTLDDVLQRLEANLRRYDKSLPSLFCDETVDSKLEPSFPKQDAVVASVFRLKRTANGDGTSSLVESRDVISVNGKNPADHKADLPVQLDGAFAGSFAVVSLDQSHCFQYSMKRVDKRHPTGPYVIRFSSLPTPSNPSGCLLNEKSDGLVLIDPATFEMTHLEINTSHHLIRPGNEYVAPYRGKRAITIDYSPVSFDRTSFWLPSVINLKVIGGGGTFKQTTWSFHGEYRNCHQLQVRSRILTEHEAAQH